MSNLVIRKCDINAKFEKLATFLYVQNRYFQHIFEMTIEGIFEDLEFNSK